MNSTLEHYAQALQERVKQDMLRSLRASRPLPFGLIELNGKQLVNFASNDYLGLSQHPLLIERSRDYVELYGAGSGSSRLLSGNLAIFEQVENKLARLKGTETALIMPSGFQANSSLIPTLLDKQSLAAADRLVHRSLIEGLQLSAARWFRFRHNDFDDMKVRFERAASSANSASSGCSTNTAGSIKQDSDSTDSSNSALSSNSANSGQSRDKRWLITESVFSADGDRLDVAEVVRLAKEMGLALFIDEAHATGLFGVNGMGLSSGTQIPGVVMGTFGKGLGSFGAYVCCSSLMREYLINFCPGLIYSTALPPAVLGAIDAALDLIPQMDAERESLQSNAEELRTALHALGFETGASSTQIIPIIVGSSTAALALSTYLENEGFFVPAIRPPTVPEGAARLRLSLSAVHTKDQIEKFLQILRKWHEKKN